MTRLGAGVRALVFAVLVFTAVPVQAALEAGSTPPPAINGFPKDTQANVPCQAKKDGSEVYDSSKPPGEFKMEENGKTVTKTNLFGKKCTYNQIGKGIEVTGTCVRIVTNNVPKDSCKCESYLDSAGKRQPCPKELTGPESTGSTPGGKSTSKSADFKNPAVQEIAKQVVQNIDPATDAGKGQLAQALQNIDPTLSKEDALKKVQDNPDAAYQLIKDIAGGNTTAAQDDAQKLNLNRDTVSNISTLQPSDVFKGVASNEQLDKIATAAHAQSTFAQPGDQTALDQQNPNTSGGRLIFDPHGDPIAPVTECVDNGKPCVRIDPAMLGTIITDTQSRLCAKVGTEQCWYDPWAVGVMMNESNGNALAAGSGSDKGLMQVTKSTAGDLLQKFQDTYGEPYLLSKIKEKDLPTYNPEWVAQQSVQMGALVLQDKGEHVDTFQSQLSRYNGGGQTASDYASRALDNVSALENGTASSYCPYCSYWQTAYNTAMANSNSPPPYQNLNPFNPVTAYQREVYQTVSADYYTPQDLSPVPLEYPPSLYSQAQGTSPYAALDSTQFANGLELSAPTYPTPPPRPEYPIPNITRNLSYGSSGDDVIALQNWLGITADGNYGIDTRNAVAAWQRANCINIVSDYGYFGPRSRACLAQ